MQNYPKAIEKQIRAMQRDELIGYLVYKKIAKRMKISKNREILERIAQQEKNHYDIWSTYLGELKSGYRFKVFIYHIISILFGYTFALKIMENAEDKSKRFYHSITEHIPEAKDIALEEESHEMELIELLDEERLNYVGSMVLGLNDALVELSGTLAGLTFALQDPKLISLSGLITGIAASFSMAASEYLSAKADNLPNAFKSAVYTGVAYLITVALLVIPYLVIPSNPYLSLAIMLGIVVFIIFFFNWYISVAKSVSFKKRFWPMISISLGVAVLSFGIGLLVKFFLGIDI
ncbi:MAG: rubrerythrin family protein [Methanomicrobia archaeon]|nr:rubrerythrin family protein [Methanomicrobia archaeon]